jgi:hypothetical protein
MSEERSKERSKERRRKADLARCCGGPRAHTRLELQLGHLSERVYEGLSLIWDRQKCVAKSVNMMC